MKNCSEFQKLDKIVKESDAIFLKVDTIAVNKCKALKKVLAARMKSARTKDAADPNSKHKPRKKSLTSNPLTNIGFMSVKEMEEPRKNSKGKDENLNRFLTTGDNNVQPAADSPATAKNRRKRVISPVRDRKVRENWAFLKS